MTWYKTGTIAVTIGEATVTGSGTSWAANVAPGDTLKIGGALYEITAVGSDTSLTIGETYPDATASGLSYAIVPTSLAWSLPVSGDASGLVGASTVGMIAQVADGAFQAREIEVSGEGLDVSAPDGVSGNPTITLDDDLEAIEALDGVGFAARTGANTWALRVLTGATDEIEITEGDGEGDDPTIGFPTTVNFGTKGVIISDTGLEIRDDTDVTRIVKFQASGITPGETRTFAFPDASGTFALAEESQPLSAVLTDLAALGSALEAGDLLTGLGENNLGALPIGAVGSFLRVLSAGLEWDSFPLGLVIQHITTSQTYTPSAGMLAVLAIATGAGGGGGGVSVLAAAHMALAGAGGGAGSTAISAFLASDIGTSKHATIGTGGAGGVGNAAGAAGGSTGLGTALNDFSLMRANGGNGGAQASRSSTGLALGAPGAAVLASLAQCPIYGAQGRPGSVSYGTTLSQYAATSGDGGASFWGGGAPGVNAINALVNGATGVAVGSGGSGAAAALATTGTANGGSGANGALLLIEIIAT